MQTQAPCFPFFGGGGAFVWHRQGPGEDSLPTHQDFSCFSDPNSMFPKRLCWLLHHLSILPGLGTLYAIHKCFKEIVESASRDVTCGHEAKNNPLKHWDKITAHMFIEQTCNQKKPEV